mgnify:CR=1 FL=1
MQLGQEMTGVARQLLNIGDWMRQSAIVLVVLVSGDLDHSIFRYFLLKRTRIEFISKIQTIGFMKKIRMETRKNKIRRWNGNGIKEWT